MTAWQSDVSPVRGPQVAATTREDLAPAALVTVALAVLGALLGVLWGLWSPPGPAAAVLSGGGIVPDETEAFVAGDGRYLVITAVTGVAAALLAWFLRSGNRGTLMLAGLALGTGAGALLTELVGHLTGGGSDTGKTYPLAGGGTEQITAHLPLSLHTPGLLFIEPLAAVLVYGLFVSFAVRDDLGRPDAKRTELSRAVLVGAGHQAQDGGGDSDAAGALQQGDLPAQ